MSKSKSKKKREEAKSKEPNLKADPNIGAKPSLPKMKPQNFLGKGNVSIQKSTPKPPTIRRTGHKG